MPKCNSLSYSSVHNVIFLSLPLPLIHKNLNVAYLGTPFKSKFTKFTYMLISKSVKYLIYGFKLERRKEYLYAATCAIVRIHTQ